MDTTKPILLLHGFGSGSFAFDPVRSRMPSGLDLIIPDLPGHGSMVAAGGQGAGRIAKAMLTALHTHGESPVHVVGHSLGGAVAALMALREPHRIASLTLLAPGGFGPDINAGALAAYGTAREAEEIRAALVPFFAKGTNIPEALVAAMASCRREEGAIAALDACRAAMLTEASGGRAQGVLPLADLASLDLPIRLLWGTEDAIVPVTQADVMEGHAEILRLQDVGHMLMDEVPEIVAETIMRAVTA